jgi:hypothetical protein
MSAPQWPGPGDRPPASIEQYAPPRRRAGWLVVLGVVVVVAALAIAAWQVSRNPESASGGVTPSATPTVQTPPAAAPTATAAASSIPFVVGSGQATGQWTITDVSWSSGGVTLSMRIKVSTGTLSSYSFFLMENDSTDIHESQSQGWSDDISNGTIQAGETVTGRVYFPSPKVASTVMLVRGSDTDPVAALTIPA